MGPLIDENKLQFEEKVNKTEKFEKYLKMYIINLKTIRYKRTASGNIIYSNLNFKLKRPVSSLRLPKEQKEAKTSKSKK